MRGEETNDEFETSDKTINLIDSAISIPEDNSNAAKARDEVACSEFLPQQNIYQALLN